MVRLYYIILIALLRAWDFHLRLEQLRPLSLHLLVWLCAVQAPAPALVVVVMLDV